MFEVHLHLLLLLLLLLLLQLLRGRVVLQLRSQQLKSTDHGTSIFYSTFNLVCPLGWASSTSIRPPKDPMRCLVVPLEGCLV
jgi:hypothetical protein